MSYRHRLRVRYGECDMQQVVFNANYLAYVDDAIDSWMREVLGDSFEALEFDFMVKRATVEWHAAGPLGETCSTSTSPSRGGAAARSTSASTARSASSRCSRATLVYVSTVPGEPTSTPVPDWVRDARSASLPADGRRRRVR